MDPSQFSQYAQVAVPPGKGKKAAAIVAAIVVVMIVLAVVVLALYLAGRSAAPTRTASGALSTDPAGSELFLAYPAATAADSSGNYPQGGIALTADDLAAGQSSSCGAACANNVTMSDYAAALATAFDTTYRVADAGDLAAALAVGAQSGPSRGWANNLSGAAGDGSYTAYIINQADASSQGITAGVTAIANPSDCGTGSGGATWCCASGTCPNGDNVGVWLVGPKPASDSGVSAGGSGTQIFNWYNYDANSADTTLPTANIWSYFDTTS